MARRVAVARGETDTPTSARRKTAAKNAKPAAKAASKSADVDAVDSDEAPDETAAARENALASSAGSTPRVGAKPSTKRNPGSRPSGNRPGGNRRR
jgi:hypothetical protein